MVIVRYTETVLYVSHSESQHSRLTWPGRTGYRVTSGSFRCVRYGRVFYWIIFFIGTLYVPAYIVLGFWLVQQVIAFPSSMESAGGVAIAAHLGGFISGFVLTPFLKKSNIKLFQSGNTKAFSRYR